MGQGGTEMPRMVMFGPVKDYEPTTGTFVAADAATTFRQSVDPHRVTPSSKVGNAATVLQFFDSTAAPNSVIDVPWGFLDDVAARNASVVAFLGHSITGSKTPPLFSVGMEFADYDLLKHLPPSAENFQYVNWEPFYQPPAPGETEEEAIATAKRLAEPFAFRVDSINAQAKIVFVASCYLGPEFLSLWNIDQDSQDRALIVPITPTETDIYTAARYAWPAFAKALSEGKKLFEAIDAANNSCQAAGVTCSSTTAKWKRIGGNDQMQLVK